MLGNRDAILRIDDSTTPVSPFQHREWMLWKMSDGRNARIVAAARKFAGRIDDTVVRERLKAAVGRHPSLRLAFDADKPVASIVPRFTVPLDLRHAGINESLAEAVARLSREASHVPFALSTAPALRAVLVRAGQGKTAETALVLVAHPIIADERSLECILEEIDTGKVPETPDNSFLTWTALINSREGQGMEGPKLSFYKQMLKGVSFWIDLPTDWKRPPVFNSEGADAICELPDSDRKSIERLAGTLKTRPEVVVLAGVIGYLGRVSRQPDVVIGLASDLRPADGETYVGPFENTSVLRIPLEDSLTAQQLIERVRDHLEALAPHRDLPFERLIETLQPERDASRTPIFQVHFAHRIRGDSQAWLSAPTGRVATDLEIVLDQKKKTLSLCIRYRTDLFGSDTIRRMGIHLYELLKGMCAKPDETVNLISMCTSEERDWILSTLGVQRRFSAETTVHSVVADTAARYPEATAVCSGDVRLSYGELNRRANQLAHRLCRLGVRRDVAVAVCMDRSEELIVALLAILKAGGVYLPIEPANPRERIEFFLADSKAQLVLTEAAEEDKVTGSSAQVMVLEPGGDDFSSEPTTNPEELTGPDGLCYIIYTSGSTGKPKGVLINHRNVVRLFKATHHWFGFNARDVWTMFHSVAFDFSVWEIWGALMYGGRLVVVPYLVSRSPWDFYKLLTREKVTVLNQTPSAFRQLIQVDKETEGDDLPLRLVIFGGEALEFESLRPWFERHGDQVPCLVNMYGITETCVHVTYRPVSIRDLELGQGASIIGVPIPDLCIYVVDERLELLPVGIPGELVVGGAGLARGYLSRPELTMERFVPSPFSSVQGDRLYRSGDLVRLMPTGEIDYLGRIDLQVKIRGFRIETGEVEAALRRSGLVQDVTVVPWRHPLQGDQLVAYVVSESMVGDLRRALRSTLPEYMVPSHFVTLPTIPMTINGKVDRKALPEPRPVGHMEQVDDATPVSELEQMISEIWCEVLGVDDVSTQESFFDIGGNSLGVVRVATHLRERLGRSIDVTMLFQYPSVAALAGRLAQKDGRLEADGKLVYPYPHHCGDDPIAIVGMAGRFPGAPDVEALWTVLVKGAETITFFSTEGLDPSIDPAIVADPAYVKARGILEGAELFDAAFFGMTPREAEVTDPQQRVLLELAWEALEHAGCNPSMFPGLIGVYVGEYNNTYYLENVLKRPDILANVGAFQAMLGNEKDFAATRIAHRLDLKGPALSIYTACSTSLVAVVHAFYALRTRQCDLALAGAASITCPQRSGYLYQEGGMLSPDGHTRPFDEGAKGTVFSDGAAMVVLRRLSDALASNDSIYGVIRGAATNNDGIQRMSFSAPTVEGQARVIGSALAVAGVHPETISYVETHGTATPLGDPIEVEALKQAFWPHTTNRGYCTLGSIKSNIGHVTAAAGVAGLIKTVLALNRELIPPTIGFSRHNPEINFENSPFFVSAKLLPWPRRPGMPRRAGVSSFGVGGTNAHVIVEEAPLPVSGGPFRSQQLLVVSAQTSSGLEAITVNLAAHLERHPRLFLPDVASTLQSGRKAFAHRRAVVASSSEEAIAKLRSANDRFVFTGKAFAHDPSIVFLFPGQGAQYVNMGRDLYEGEPVFRDAVERCSQVLKRHIELDLRQVMYPDEERLASAEEEINQTWLAQPAIFVVEYALSKLWMNWGVKPTVLIGHSIGEYVAAVIAETFTLEDALALLSVRARLMQPLPPGSMLSVRVSAEALEAMLPEGASIAAINSPVLCAVSGPTDVIQDFQEQLESKGIANRLLHTSHAFHSEMMDPMLPEFASFARQIPTHPPKIPWVSTCFGRWINLDDLASGDYWVRQVRHTVRFAEALNVVVEDPKNILLEVGPGQTLNQLARQHTRKFADLKVVSSLGPVADPEGDLTSILASLGQLWIAGVTISWESFAGDEKRKRVPLPTYPFERKRYWIDPIPAAPAVVQDFNSFGSGSPLEHKTTEGPEMPISHISPVASTSSRKDRLVKELLDMFQSYSGSDLSQSDENTSFLELGFDSLLLTQASQGALKRFGVKVTFRQLISDLSTLSTLAAFLDEKLPPEAVPQPVPASAPSSSSTPRATAGTTMPTTASQTPRMSSPSGRSLLETVIQEQMKIMAQQLESLRQSGLAGGALSPRPLSEAELSLPRHQPVVKAITMGKQSHFGPFKPIEKGVSGALTERQQKALNTLVARYNLRTKQSKALAQEHRGHFCDPRAAGNFRQLWKEMVYPIVCARSKGSRIWDIDGNEYIDVTMGFGVNYLGHSPDFVMQALEEQMKGGVEIGPQSPLAGEVAQMICELTGLERATFCNTGSEAVMASLRVARTVTGREKIVYFYGDYHGIFDEVLGRPALFDDAPGALPIAPGIPPMNNVMILEYGSPSALDAIRKHSNEIAAVLVEPVQSRHPDLQPREFLHELRRITEEKGIALIFDEVITGFRIAPGGAQEYFGVKADLACYGKVVGGGMPIGVLAGAATYLDALDGGFWRYGDDSFPPTGVTFFAGTFVRHPLAIAAAHAVLKYLKAAGPKLQERVNNMTARFVEMTNAFFEERQLPMRLQTFSAIFYYDFHPDLKFAGLFFYYLRDRDVHIWEGRVGCLSISHTDQDMDSVLVAFQKSVEEMQSGGFLPESGRDVAQGALGRDTVASQPPPDAFFRFPLAEAQREMWIGSQMRPEAAGPHHACTGLYLDGDLDIEMLRRAISAVVERHEGLRCTFSADGTEAILHPHMIPEVPLHDFSSLPEPQKEARLNEILNQEGRRLLDLTKGPLVQFQIVKLSQQKHLLILTAQMIVCDGWSHYVVFEDLGTFYSAFVAGTEPSLKPVVQMREYALWEQAHSVTDEARASEAFWLSQFQTVPPPINLPTSRPRPPSRTFEGDRREVFLPKELYWNIRRLAKEQKNSYFAVLLAAFQVWLYRLSGTRDLVVGVPFAAQGPLDMDRLVGQCASILPLRVQIESDESFSNVLRKAWSSVLDAQEHWDFTFGRLIPELDLPHDPSRIPLVSALFNIDPPMAKVKFRGLEHRFVTGPRYYFQYDLGFNLVEKEDSIQVECDYNRNLFDGDVMQCWAESYKALLEAIISNPEQSIRRLPMRHEEETQRLLEGGIKASSSDGPAVTVHELVERQAERTPDAIAARCTGRSITYRDLDEKSNRTAGHLRALGIGPDLVAGVCMEKSPEMVTALLAILKAGGAYVLIEPSSIHEHLLHIVRDTGMQVILTDQKTTSCLPETSARVVLLKEMTVASEDNKSDLPPAFVGPERLSCVVYKPSPDGKLKGVDLTHRSIANLLLSIRRQAMLGPQDVLLWLSPLSSHTEALELWLPLTLGAQVSISPDVTVLDPAAVCRLMDEKGITAMLATPSAWRLLLAFGWSGNSQIKALCTGEALRLDLADRLGKICREVWNIYGAAETSGCSMAGRVRTGEPVTLGRPLDNTHVMVADTRFEPAPVGVPGGIFVSGTGLARCYRNQPSLTDETFINVFRGDENLGRFYRTGDLGRYLPNGQIEFIGHRDGQVKIRDGTIELSEIETTLRGHAAVGDVALSFDGEEQGVVAYLVPDKREKTPLSSNPSSLVKELHRFMRNALPRNMVPSHFVVMDALPRKLDGTVNRLALPIPEDIEIDLNEYVAPRNSTEETLADIWKDLLNLPKVSVKDSFFDLSGKSLLAVRLFVRMEEAFGRKLPLATLFQAPTIEQLARKLTAADDSGSEWPSLVPIQPNGRKSPLFLVHGAGGNVLLYRSLATYLAPDYPLYGLQSQGLDGKSRPLETFEEMAAHYLREVRKIQPRGPYLLGGYCLGGTIAYEMAQGLLAAGEKVPMVAMFDTYNFIRALKASFLSFLIQKIRFHWGNIVHLGPITLWRYLREKSRIAGDGGWAHMGTERPGSALDEGVARAESGIEASVQEINDHAGDIYNPRPYPGVVTLFKPQVNYKFYPDPQMGWGDLAQALDIVELPMNPHAMLTEPYVQVLARELKARLDRLDSP